jgi:error-prone DNA polymerase
MSYLRKDMNRRGVVPISKLDNLPDGEEVRTAGAVIVRQRPGTAKGFVFFTVEDETGTVQSIIRPDIFRRYRQLIVRSPMLIIDGTLQKQDGTISVRAKHFEEVRGDVALASHDFH